MKLNRNHGIYSHGKAQGHSRLRSREVSADENLQVAKQLNTPLASLA